MTTSQTPAAPAEKTKGAYADEIKAAVQKAAEDAVHMLPQPWSKRPRPYTVTAPDGSKIEYK